MTTDTPRTAMLPVDTIAARLVLARLHAGRMSIRDAAKLCGFTNETWSGWERGRNPQDLLSTVETISEKLGVDRDWLLWGGPLTPEAPRRVHALKPRVLKRAGETSMSYATPDNGRRRTATRTTPAGTPGHAAPPTRATRAHATTTPAPRDAPSRPAP